MNTRTTQIDRRIGTLCLQGIPTDLPEEAVKGHLEQAGLFHEALDQLLRSDLTQVDMGFLALVLQGQKPDWVGAQFQSGVLEAVRGFGGQFAQARMTSVPGGETLESQHRTQVIRFWTNWQFKRLGKDEELTIAPSIASQVIYLPDLVQGSLGCAYDKVEGRDSVQDVLGRLPQVEGLRWVVGNTPTVCRVLADHLRETSEYLLPGVYTWTDGIYCSPVRGSTRLLVGFFGSRGVDVNFCPPDFWRGDVGLFVLGISA